MRSTAPPINSRTGKQSSIATNEQPRRVIATDAHARVIAPPVSVETAGTFLVVVVAQVLPPIGDDLKQLLIVTLVLSELPQTFNMTLVMIKQKTLEYNVHETAIKTANHIQPCLHLNSHHSASRDRSYRRKRQFGQPGCHSLQS